MSKIPIVQSVHRRLLNIRDQTGEQFNHLLARYGLERLLYRIVASGYGDDFVLKGAMLFALWQDVPGRPTRDIDFLGFGDVNQNRMRDVFSEACNADVVNDGLTFDSDSIVTSDIRDDHEYHGIRVRMMAYLGKAKLPIQIDIGFGDAILPVPSRIDYPVMLDFPAPRIRAYHPATVVAEKFNAMVTLGMMNSRLKDFYDVHVILYQMDIDVDELSSAIDATFKCRKTPLPSHMPLAFTEVFFKDGDKEKQWQAFLRRSLLSDFGLSFSEVATEIREKLWPIVDGIPRG